MLGDTLSQPDHTLGHDAHRGIHVQRRTFTLVLTSLALTGAVLAPPASGQPGFISDVSTLTNHQSAGEYAVAVAPDGTAHAIWIEQTGTTFQLMSSSRPRGGSWTTPVQVDTGSTTQDAQPSMAVDARGRVVAAWRDYLPQRTGSVIRTATLTGTSWGPTQDLTPGTTHAFQPDVAVGADGTAAIAWTQRLGLDRTVLGGARRTVGGSWTTSDPAVSPAASRATVAVQPDGRAVVVFTDGRVRTTDLSRSATWSAPGTLSDADSTDVDVVADAAGQVTAVWSTTTEVQSASRPAGGAWTATSVLAGPTDGLAWQVDLGVGSSGEALAAWVVSGDGNRSSTLGTASRVRGTWATTMMTAPDAYNSSPTVGFGPGGSSVVMWTGSTEQLSSTRTLYAVTRMPGEDWVAPTALASGAVSGPLAAIDAAGHGTLVWAETDALRSQVFDGVGPRITKVDRFVFARSGRTKTYRASAKDAWSRPRVSWAFDGRAPVAGAKVSRRLPSGIHHLSVTATDSAANTTTVRGTAIVAGAKPDLRATVLHDRVVRLGGSPAATRTTVSYRLSAPALVRVQVLTRSGKVVATTKMAAGAGRKAIRLDARRLELRAGRHLVRVVARNALGRTVSARLPLRVKR